jgi:NAD+ synthase
MTTGKKSLTLVMAQLNPTVGALAANADLLRACRAAHADADVIIAGELFLTGYPPEDLVLKRAFVGQIAKVAAALVEETKDGGPALIFGLPTLENGQLYNSVMVADGGQASVRHKHHLPNYAVFDENVYSPPAHCRRRLNCAACVLACRFAKIFGLPMLLLI